MKRILGTVLALVLLTGSCAFADSAVDVILNTGTTQAFTVEAGQGDPNGTAVAVNYVGSSDNGMGGAVRVMVITFGGEIVNIKVTDQNETVGIGDVALEQLVAQAKEKKSADVDTVTGEPLPPKPLLKR